MWLSDDGTQMKLGTVITSAPKELLFNEICKMIMIAPNIFKIDGNQNIRKLIQTGSSPREHHFAEINGNVLSIMERYYVCNSK